MALASTTSHRTDMPLSRFLLSSLSVLSCIVLALMEIAATDVSSFSAGTDLLSSFSGVGNHHQPPHRFESAAMDENLEDRAALLSRMELLERERNEIRNDIEQICMQHAGPSYIVVATRMHFQRRAGLEQEIDELKKLTSCLRENVNLQEELSQAYLIKIS